MDTEEKIYDVYLAGPWFTPEQDSRLEEVLKILRLNGLEVFSPKHANLFVLGQHTPKEILDGNIDAINKSKMLVAITDGKDVGTIWESGYAYAKDIPIIYVWLTHSPGQKFNIMLAASGTAIHTIEELDFQLYMFSEHGKFDGLEGDYEYE